MTSTTKIRLLGSAARDPAIGEAFAALVAGEGEPAELVLLGAEDLEEIIEDRLAAAAYERTRGQEFLPVEMVDRLLAGENRVRVWREHRGLTLQALADKAGLKSRGYIADIEAGRREGTIGTMKKLAVALGVDLDDLAPPDSLANADSERQSLRDELGIKSR
jgi:ribosome-binding protein aMBF1 (putative translation factor)